MDISFIIPTRNRASVLLETLDRLGSLDISGCSLSFELLVVDNASDESVDLPALLDNGIPVRALWLDRNHNTAARNIAAAEAHGAWLVMLDDDSSPEPGTDWSALGELAGTVGAVGGEIMLPGGEHESGGLPEVIIGCGCAIRRGLFIELGGYDTDFGYYAEEYDLCARLIAGGHEIRHTRALQFLHRKSTVGRDFNEIIYRLVRNNAWVMQRYAPETCRLSEIDAVVQRYRAIAELEGATEGFERGLAELEDTISEQPRSPLREDEWDRFTGRAAVRATLRERAGHLPGRVRLVGEPNAKGRGIIEQELIDARCELTRDPDASAVIGALSPGPMMDLHAMFPDAISPWRFEDTPRIST